MPAKYLSRSISTAGKKYAIISNSSFSWWGSWLCNYDDKIIISPRRWFTEESGMTYNDIHTKEMILI